MSIKQKILDFLANTPPDMLGDILLNIVRVGTPAGAIALTLIIVRSQGLTRRTCTIIATIVVYLLTLLLAIPALTVKPYGDYIVSLGGAIRSFSYLIWLILTLLTVADIVAMNAYMKRILQYRESMKSEEGS